MTRFLQSALAAAMVLSPSIAHAGTKVPFERAAFEAARAANKPILVEVSAWWCPVCASQSRTIESTLNDPRNRDLIVFKLNYDRQKDEWRSFGVRKQGTLIAFKAGSEVGRLEFVTNKPAILGLISKTES